VKPCASATFRQWAADATVESDETVIGRLEGAPQSTGKMGGRSGFRNVALTLVERGDAA